MVGGYGILAVVTLFFKYSGYEGCAWVWQDAIPSYYLVTV